MRIEIKEKCFGEICLMATADDIFNVVWIERNDESKWYDFDSIGHFNIELDIHFFDNLYLKQVHGLKTMTFVIVAVDKRLPMKMVLWTLEQN